VYDKKTKADDGCRSSAVLGEKYYKIAEINFMQKNSCELRYITILVIGYDYRKDVAACRN
jgi:hypothetical protein